ncbi:MAG: hypothetical protein AMXMBFR64_57690 [Myxococcales bacterium]
MAGRGRPRKFSEPTVTIWTRVRAGLGSWLNEQRDIRLSKADVIASALELYLTLRSPQSRPPGYELSEETRALLAELRPPEPPPDSSTE